MNRNKNHSDIIYFDTVTHISMFERSYAIHLLKKHHYIEVYSNRSVMEGHFIERWYHYIPKRNNYHYCGEDLGVEDVCTILGSFWDKHLNRWIHGRMPATKEVKYLKNYRIE